MHVRADAVCIGDSRTDGVRFGDARPGRTSAATALVPVGDIARIANAGFIHSRTATATAAAHAASGGLARRRAGCIVLARAARGRHHPAVQPQTILTADLHGLLDPLEPARGPCLLGCITAHALQLGAGNLTGPDQFHHRKRRLRVKDESEHERRRGQRQRACGHRGDAGNSASAPYPAGASRAK